MKRYCGRAPMSCSHPLAGRHLRAETEKAVRVGEMCKLSRRAVFRTLESGNEPNRGRPPRSPAWVAIDGAYPSLVAACCSCDVEWVQSCCTGARRRIRSCRTRSARSERQHARAGSTSDRCRRSRILHRFDDAISAVCASHFILAISPAEPVSSSQPAPRAFDGIKSRCASRVRSSRLLDLIRTPKLARTLPVDLALPTVPVPSTPRSSPGLVLALPLAVCIELGTVLA